MAAQTFWHSSSHVLGEALEAEFGVDLTIGPAIEEGFYYDCYMGDRALGDPEKERLNRRIAEVRLLPSLPPAVLPSANLKHLKAGNSIPFGFRHAECSSACLRGEQVIYWRKAASCSMK